MELQVKIAGCFLLALALLHCFLPRRFNWKTELGSLNLLNRQIMYVHTFFIGLIILLMGLLCLFSAKELVSTALGKRICLAMAIFWIARLFIQFFGYSAKLWKGKAFETSMHILFSLLWIYFGYVFGRVYFL